MSFRPDVEGAFMALDDQALCANTLLRSLDDADFQLLAARWEKVNLKREQVLVTAHEPIEHVYFLNGGIASIVSSSSENGRTEVGIFGREGVSATALLLGADRSPHETFMQVDGSTAFRLEAASYNDALSISGTLRLALLRYVQVMIVQVSQSAVANARYQIEARLARWLLMCRDRVDQDQIALTHDFMATMIGAQRSGVTVALHVLEGTGMIRSTRGWVTIVDRGKLEELAGDSYGPPEAEYDRLVRPFGRS